MCSHSLRRRSYPVTEWELRAEISILLLSPLLRSPGDRLAPGTLCYMLQCLLLSNKILHCWGKFWTNDPKRPKNATATSEEPGAKAGDCACLRHTMPPKGWAKHQSHPSGPTPRHSPPLTWYKEPAHLPQWASKGTCCLFSLRLLQSYLNEVLPELLVWSLINFCWWRRPGTLVGSSGMNALPKKKSCTWSPGMEGQWRRSDVADSLRPHGLGPTRLLCPWNFPGKSTGVGIFPSFSRGSSQPKDWTQVSHIAGRRFTVWATGDAHCHGGKQGLWQLGAGVRDSEHGILGFKLMF